MDSLSDFFHALPAAGSKTRLGSLLPDWPLRDPHNRKPVAGPLECTQSLVSLADLISFFFSLFSFGSVENTGESPGTNGIRMRKA